MKAKWICSNCANWFIVDKDYSCNISCCPFCRCEGFIKEGKK